MLISAQSIKKDLTDILEKIQTGDDAGAIRDIKFLDGELAEASLPVPRRDKTQSRSAPPQQYSADLPLYEGVREKLRMIAAHLRSGKHAAAVETTTSAIATCSTFGA